MKQTSKYQLHLLSKVSSVITRKLKHQLNKNALWLFTGYCFEPIPVGYTFDIIADAETSNWNHNYQIRLLDIVDEAGNYHKSIPEGYKTICLVECLPSIPALIKSLPSDKSWNFKRKGLYTIEHSSINILKPFEELTALNTIVSMFKKHLQSNHTNAISRADAERLFSDSSDVVIDNLIISGSVKEEKGNLVLLDV